MYQASGPYWRFWFPHLASFLLETQRADGSWWDGPGAAYATAMGVVLAVVTLAMVVSLTLLGGNIGSALTSVANVLP